MAHVPLSFEYPDDTGPADLLECANQDGLTTVRWPLLALTVVHPTLDDIWLGPDLDAIARMTPGFQLRGRYGFTLGQYTEILAIQEHREFVNAVVRMGTAELTLGEPTPLFRYLFASLHDRDVHGEWEFLHSLRLWMCPPELAEAYLLDGYAALAKLPAVSLRLHSLFDYEYPEEGDEASNLIQLELPPAVTDIEPLRLYHDGLTQNDAGTAILQHYRVLEYYSIVSRHGEIDALRRRSDLNSRQFTLEVAKLIADEERASICRLVASLADAAILKQAVDSVLIDRPQAHILGNRLYDFRNSIVHAKQDHRTQMFVPSVFEDPPELIAWR